MSREHKHKIKLAFNDDEIISYCEECGKILDVYKRVKETYPVYYPIYQYYPYYWGQPIVTSTDASSSVSLNGTSVSSSVCSAGISKFEDLIEKE